LGGSHETIIFVLDAGIAFMLSGADGTVYEERNNFLRCKVLAFN
jgi:hypothetical protein